MCTINYYVTHVYQKINVYNNLTSDQSDHVPDTVLSILGLIIIKSNNKSGLQKTVMETMARRCKVM